MTPIVGAHSSHRKKREAKIKRDIKRGVREPNEQDPFELFIAVTDIRYTYYKDSAKILGQTFGMLVLQDYEAITPNLLARTIETVEGGGIVVLLLKTMSSLKQLYSMTMVSCAVFLTSSHAGRAQPVPHRRPPVRPAPLQRAFHPLARLQPRLSRPRR